MSWPAGCRTTRWSVFLAPAEARALDVLRDAGGAGGRPLSRATLLRALTMRALEQSRDPRCRTALAALRLEPAPDGSRGGRPPTIRAGKTPDGPEAGEG